MSLTIRWASTADQVWIDTQYQDIDFLPSDVQVDRVAIAEWEGQPSGLGRLVPVGDQQWELGGMYVLPDFRRKGIARRVVQYLLDATDAGTTLYCIPFLHLSTFYESFGFRKVPKADLDEVPAVILSKRQWCDTNYENQMGLLVTQL